jgi:hypothetical protein
MTGAYADAAHVTEWVAENDAEVVGADVSERFHSALLTLPWSRSQPDWRALDTLEFDIESPTLDADIQSAAFARFAYAFLIYTPEQAGIVAERSALLRDVGLLTSKYGGQPSFMCGVTRTEGGIEIVPSALAVCSADTLRLLR